MLPKCSAWRARKTASLQSFMSTCHAAKRRCRKKRKWFWVGGMCLSEMSRGLLATTPEKARERESDERMHKR